MVFSPHRIVQILLALLAGMPLPKVLADDAVADSGTGNALHAANGLLQRGLYDLAAAEYESLLKKERPAAERMQARYGLGICRLRLGQADAAAEALSAPAASPTFAQRVEAAVLLAQARMAGGAFAEAAGGLAELLPGLKEHTLADEAGALLVECRFRAGDYARTRKAADAFLVQKWPAAHRARVRYFGALAAAQLGEWSDVRKRLKDVPPDDEFGGPVILLLGQAHQALGDWPRAAVAFRRVLERPAPALHAEARLGLALALQQQERRDEALPLLKELLAQQPSAGIVVQARLALATIHIDRSEFAAARKVLAKLPFDAKDSSSVVYELARCDLLDGNAAGAEARLRGLLAQDGDKLLRSSALLQLAIAQMQQEHYEASLETLGQFGTEFPGDASSGAARRYAASCRYQLGDYQQAADLCRAILKADPDDGAIRRMFADSLFAMRDFAGARAIYQQVLDVAPDDDDANMVRLLLGTCLYEESRYDEALTALAAAYRRDVVATVKESGAFLMGAIHFDRGEWKSAAEMFRAHLDAGLPSNRAAAQLRLGIAQSRQDDSALAIASLTAASEDAAVRSHALFERGLAQIALKAYDGARDDFLAVVAGDQAQEATGLVSAARRQLAWLALRSGDHTEAAAQYGALGSDEMTTGDRLRMAQAGEALGRDDILDTTLPQLLAGDVEPALRAQAQMLRARQQARRSDRAAAVATLQQIDASMLDAESRIAWYYEQARNLRALERHDEAARHYRRLVQQHADHSLGKFAALELASIEAAQDRHEAAVALLSPLLERLTGDDPLALRTQSLYRLGASEYERDNHRAAAERLEAFCTSFTESALVPSASVLAGESWLAVGQAKKALAALQRVTAHADASTEMKRSAQLRAADALVAMQAWARAEAAYGQYRKAWPADDQGFRAQFGIAWAREQQGRFDEAISAYEVLIAEHQGETAARAQFQIGECLFAKRDYESAIRAFLKVDIVYAYPQWQSAALFEAGRCFEALRRTAEAREQYEAVVQQHADTNWATQARQRLKALEKSRALPGRSTRTEAGNETESRRAARTRSTPSEEDAQ